MDHKYAGAGKTKRDNRQSAGNDAGRGRCSYSEALVVVANTESETKIKPKNNPVHSPFPLARIKS